MADRGSAYLFISPELIADILKGFRSGESRNFQIIANALPQDADVEKVEYDDERNFVKVLLRSSSFTGERQLLEPPILQVNYS